MKACSWVRRVARWFVYFKAPCRLFWPPLAFSSSLSPFLRPRVPEDFFFFLCGEFFFKEKRKKGKKPDVTKKNLSTGGGPTKGVMDSRVYVYIYTYVCAKGKCNFCKSNFSNIDFLRRERRYTKKLSLIFFC